MGVVGQSLCPKGKRPYLALTNHCKRFGHTNAQNPRVRRLQRTRRLKQQTISRVWWVRATGRVECTRKSVERGDPFGLEHSKGVSWSFGFVALLQFAGA